MKMSAKPGKPSSRRCSTSCGSRSDALRAAGEAARKPVEEALKDIDRILWRAFRWLDEAVGHLEVIRPRSTTCSICSNVLTSSGRRSIAASSRSGAARWRGMDVLEHVELFYRFEGDKPITLRVNPAASHRASRSACAASTLPFQYQTEQDEKRVVRYGLFHVQPHVIRVGALRARLPTPQ